MIATFGPYLEERALATLGLAPGRLRPRSAGSWTPDASTTQRPSVTPEMLRLALVGTAEEAGERIVALRDAGVTNVSLGGALGDDPREAIRLVGEVIAPMCRARHLEHVEQPVDPRHGREPEALEDRPGHLARVGDEHRRVALDRLVCPGGHERAVGAPAAR